MIKKGLLDKHGKPNENTPVDWKKGYVDYNIQTEPKEAAKPAQNDQPSAEKKRKRAEKSSSSSSDSDAEAEKKKKKKEKKKLKQEAVVVQVKVEVDEEEI